MARKRLSDTAAVQAMPSPTNGKTEHTRSVRPIDNGFIVCDSSWGPEGYKSSERYSREAPDMEAPRDRMVGAENLRGAIKVLKE